MKIENPAQRRPIDQIKPDHDYDPTFFLVVAGSLRYHHRYAVSLATGVASLGPLWRQVGTVSFPTAGILADVFLIVCLLDITAPLNCAELQRVKVPLQWMEALPFCRSRPKSPQTPIVYPLRFSLRRTYPFGRGAMMPTNQGRTAHALYMAARMLGCSKMGRGIVPWDLWGRLERDTWLGRYQDSERLSFSFCSSLVNQYIQRDNAVRRSSLRTKNATRRDSRFVCRKF